MWKLIIESLKKYDEEHGCLHYWTNGDEILCKTEKEADCLANFLEDMGFEELNIGYYDPEEDRRMNEVDENTGFWWISAFY